MKTATKFIFFCTIISFFSSCKNPSERDVAGVYKGDKVSTEFSGSDFRYLVLKEDNVFYLEYLDIERKGLTGSWKILDSKNDSLNIQFHLKNRNIIGKLKGNTFLFEKPNVFDQRFSAWLYVKTNLKSDKILESR
ncbi:hypothetical protein [Flavobacterium sp.]|uniref:hypothetical protein n=1 Tax=Flavobacterium sp. TaxID=239 RepID=UPI0038D00AF1